jgi:hypothetical protein
VRGRKLARAKIYVWMMKSTEWRDETCSSSKYAGPPISKSLSNADRGADSILLRHHRTANCYGISIILVRISIDLLPLHPPLFWSESPRPLAGLENKYQRMFLA